MVTDVSGMDVKCEAVASDACAQGEAGFDAAAHGLAALGLPNGLPAGAAAPGTPSLGTEPVAKTPEEADATGESAGESEVSVGGMPLSPRWKATVAVVWAGQAVSVLSTYAASFAAMWYLTETLASPLALSVAAVASLFPIALLSPVGGAVADRCRRKAVMIVADGAAGVASLALGVLVLAGSLEVWMLLALLAARATAQAFHSPALTATVPLMVPERHLVRINSLDQMLTSGAAIVSPVIGIALYSAFGFAAVLFVDALAALIACVCLGVARIPEPTLDRKKGRAEQDSGIVRGVVRDMATSARLVTSDPPLFILVGMCMVAMLVFTPLGTLFPLITYSWFGGDGYDASMVEAACGVGLLVGSALLLVHGGGRRLVPVILGSGLAIACLVIIVSFLEGGSFPAFLAASALIFVATGVFNGPIMPIIQKRLPQEHMGKAMGIVLSLSSWAMPIGLLITGFGAEALGISRWFLISGIALTVFCLAGFASRRLRSLDDAVIEGL